MSELGFGLMRLPLKDPADQSSVDIPQLKEMVDMFLDAGLDYFDTAYMYHRNVSETAIKEALVDRYPRDRYRLATKLPIMMVDTPEKAEEVFEEQLRKTGVEYFDNYLVHNVCGEFYSNMEKCKAFDLLKRKKAEGKIRRIGFSFHDYPELLDKVLTEHPEVEFVQLQINYLDMDGPIASRKNLEVAKAHGVPVIVMEPVKGGLLADVPDEAREMFESKDPGMSPASWALRYVMGLEGVETVLSGMSSVEQMRDNLSFATDFKPLDEEELEIVGKATEIINGKVAVACTGCRYCVKGCPQDILIPDYFSLYNSEKANPPKGWSVPKMYYKNRSKGHGLASDCLECGNCEMNCPQGLPIIDLLKDVAKTFESRGGPLPLQSALGR